MAKKEVLNTAVATVRVAEPIGEVIEGVEAVGEAVVDTAAQFAADVAEFAEEFVDTAESAVETVVTITRNNPYVIAGVAVVSLGVGGYLGYRYGIKKASLKFEVELEAQMAAAKEHYKRLNKVEEFSTIEGAAEVLVPEEPINIEFGGGIETPEPVKEAVRNYRGQPAVQPPDPIDDSAPFEEGDPRIWNQDLEIADREVNPGEPYVISHMEWIENAVGHEQSPLTYYEADDTLVDERERPLDNADYLVGDDNLKNRFGHGCTDPNTVHIRNEHLDHDFEVTRSPRSYKVDVLGLTDEPELKHAYQRRARRGRGAGE